MESIKEVKFRRISTAMELLYPQHVKHFVLPSSHMANEFDAFYKDIIIEKSPSMASMFCNKTVGL